MLWKEWFRCVSQLRGACSRWRTFMWMVLVLVGFSIRTDLLGVTSFVRACLLKPAKYRCLLHVFHSTGLKLPKLKELWVQLVLKLFNPVRYKGALVLIADGIKVPKEGKKMPAVKSLHQESQNNTKPNFIMGHSSQVVAILVKGFKGQFFSIPLASRIHEGVLWPKRDPRSLLDKLVALFLPIAKILGRKTILLADAYYASRKIALPLLEAGHDLVTRLKPGTTAYRQLPKRKVRKRGRPSLYGKKVWLKDLWKCKRAFSTAVSPVYDEKNIKIRYLSRDLIWKPMGRPVRFVLVEHPKRGRIIIMSTSLLLTALEIVELYGYRFKIEVGFKQALRTLGTYAYHFWMMDMTPIRRRDGNQDLLHQSKEYCAQVRRKLRAYNVHAQLGCIAQGLLQYLSAKLGAQVWRNFGSWLRTMRTDRPPSEMVVSQALRASLPHFLTTSHENHELEKIIVENADLSRLPGLRMSA